MAFFASRWKKFAAWPWKQRLSGAFWAGGSLLTVLFGLLIGFSGYANQFRLSSPPSMSKN